MHVGEILTCSGHSAMAGALRWGPGRWRGAPRGADWDLPLGAAGIVRLQALLRASSTASCTQVRTSNVRSRIACWWKAPNPYIPSMARLLENCEVLDDA